MKLFLSVLFLAITSLSVFLVRFAVAGIPVRAMLAMLFLALVLLYRPQVAFAAARTYRFAFMVIVATALLATFVTLIDRTGLGFVGLQLLEIHVQALVGIFICAYMAAICGVNRLIILFAIPIWISILFAVAQFLGVEPAWAARAFLGRFQTEELLTQAAYLTVRDRPMGLSYSPTHLGTQACLLFAAFFIRSAYAKGWSILKAPDRGILIAAAWLVLSSVASGNRSPILGLFVFFAAYGFLTSPLRFLPIAIVGLIAMLFAQELLSLLQQGGLRLGVTDDGSAQSRSVLRAYGIYLFFDRPFGYGLAFNSTEHYWRHWDDLQNYANAEAITLYALHNYYLMVLNKYGALILPLAATVAFAVLKNWRVALGFVPYMTHIFFHNDGPLQGDFLIWYLLPLYMSIKQVHPYPTGQARRAPLLVPPRQPARSFRRA